jgi:hypothetical protein
MSITFAAPAFRTPEAVIECAVTASRVR